MPEPFDLVIRGGRVVTAEGSFDGSIGVRAGRIEAIGSVLADGADEIDATGRLVMPGGVDPHCHIEQLSGMSQLNADTFETATRSAAMGGTTSLISFAAQHRGQRLGEVVEDCAARAARGAMVDHAFHLSVSDTAAPGFARDLARLIGEGHRSVKVFTTYDIRLDDRQIMEVLAVARAAGALVCVHAENDGMIGWTRDALMAAGRSWPKDHATSRPRLAEIEAVERICRFAEYLDQPVMIFHVSTAEACAAIRAARGRGAPVWAETCPHYLLMTAEVLARDGIEGAKWMCSPPQRTEADQAALWRALALGDLQVVSSDHAPYRFDQTGKLAKGADAPFPAIANGLPGLETRLPLMFDAMVSRGHLGPEKFVEVCATAPARLYGLTAKGRIAPGMDADLVIWDPVRRTTYGENDLHDNVGYNPWAGRTVTGWPEHVLLRGERLVADGTFLGRPGSGRWLDRAATGAPPSGTPAPEVLSLAESRR